MRGKVGDKVGDTVGDEVPDEVGDKLGDKVGDKGKAREGGNRLGGVHHGFPPTSPEASRKFSKNCLFL